MTAAPPQALYVHVPFCVAHCPYCDFVVYAGSAARGPRARVSTYATALEREIALRARAVADRFGARRPELETVYFGGGTPSLLPVRSVATLLEAAQRGFGLAADAEVTLEANPAPDERGDLREMVAAGVTRLSIGAQSLDPSELRRLGRRHSPADVRATVEAARAAGMASVSLDLLYDVPGQSLASWERSLRTALEWGPDHLSLYALTLDDPDAEGLTGVLGDHLPASSGARRWRERAVAEQDDDLAAAQYRLASELLAADGWHGYEISNWARPGHESRHNLVYWRRRPYEAAGVGAHAFDGAVRRWNAARLDGYLAALVPAADQPSAPPGGMETIDDATASAEETILALRLDGGVAAGAAEAGPLRPHLAWALEYGLLERADVAGEERIRLTVRGRLLSNELFSRLV